MRKVKQAKISRNMTAGSLVKELSLSGVFGAGKLARSAEIIEEMVKDRSCRVFFGVAGAMVPGGMRNIIIDFLEQGWADVFVTTGANLTHDLVEALGYAHYRGINADDAKLNKQGIDRIYDSFMPNKAYTALENFLLKTFREMPKKELSTKDFLWGIGRKVEKKSILSICYKKRIPIFCPAIADSGIGLMAWSFIQKNKLNVNAFEDLKEMMELSWSAKKSGVIYIGGGVPKNFIQQAMQLTKGASYAVQITTATPEAGGSSGAELKEGISWGKLNRNAKYVTLNCDATIALPIITAALKDRIK
jgi:deoxyhypusine synthase